MTADNALAADAAPARTTVPTKCPYCGFAEISMQVVAWGVFKDGELQTLDHTEAVSFLPEVTAVCAADNCGKEFLWRQFT